MRFLGSCIGLLVYYLDKKHRNLAISNIIKVLRVSPNEANIIAKGSFQNFGMNIVEFLFGTSSKIQVVGHEYVNKDRGNIFVLGHFGNWELMGKAAVQKGIRLTAVGREIKNRIADWYIRNRRIGSGIEILNKKGSFKYLLNVLRRGKSAAILIDQYAGRRGIFVDFLGIPTSTTHSPVLLALRTGCPLVPVFIIREGKEHRIIVESPIKMDKTKDIKTNTQLMVQPLERYVRKYPEQWWWVHRRWR